MYGMPSQEPTPVFKYPSLGHVSSFKKPQFIPEQVFQAPVKRISSNNDVQTFLNSIAMQRLLFFLQSVNDACKDKKISEDCQVSPLTQRILDNLDELARWIDEIPPLQSPQRFGNKAFKIWFGRLEKVLAISNLERLIIELECRYANTEHRNRDAHDIYT